jgi:hypothetical protein
MPLVINGENIPDSLIEQEFAAIKSHFERLGNVSCCERDGEFREYARQNVTARVLLAQEAERAIEPLPEHEIDQAIEQLKVDHGGADRFFAATGLTPDQTDILRENVQTSLRTQKLVDRLMAGRPDPTDAELGEFYEQNIAQFMTVEEVRASHILKAPKRGEDRHAAYEELRQVREQLLEGADFEALAAQHSDKPASETDLGYFKRGELMEEFELVAFSMHVGEISPVFSSPFGFHLVKLTDRRPATPRPFEQVRDEVVQRLVQQRREAAVRQLVQELQSAASIETVEPAPQV